MVKGITKRIIMVKSPDASMFEQAFFIISDDAAKNYCSSPEKIMSEACKVANNYLKSQKKISSINFATLMAGSVGAILMASVWFICEFVF